MNESVQINGASSQVKSISIDCLSTLALHAFFLLKIMNKSHKSIWNAALGAWVAVSELAHARGKCSSTVTAAVVLALLAGGANAQSIILSGDYVVTNPVTPSPWNAGYMLTVGNTGTGALSVLGGALVSGTGNIVFGNQAGSSGTLTIDGVGSSVSTSSNGIYVGAGGIAVLNISAGGHASSAGAIIGGTATVTGIGSTWNNSDLFVSSLTDAGVLNVLGGGAVTTANGITIGNATGSHGTVTVSGINGSTRSSLVDTGSLKVGGSGFLQRGTGTLTVLDGGLVSSGGGAFVGRNAGATGTVTVSGVNANGTASTWNNTGVLAVGLNGNGTLSIANGGQVNSSGGMTIAQSVAGANGTLNIGAAAGSAAVAPGTLTSPTVAFGAGTGVLNFNHTSADYAFDPVISSGTGSATINQLAGNTNFTSNSNAFGGVTNITGGTLRVNGTLGNAASTVNVSNGGTLGGAGTIGGSVAIDNGILAPGNSPGTLTIAGNLALGSASQLNYDLGAANTVGGALNDLTVVGGNLTLAGTLNVTQSAGGTYGAGIYRLINYAGALTNNGLALGNMPAGTVNYVQTSVANQVNLVNSSGLTLNYWDGDAGGKNDGIIAGGNGTWLSGPTGTDRWTQADGLINAPYQNPSFAIFTGAPGTVTVDNSLGQIAVTGMQFATSGYRIQGGDVALTAGTNAIRVGDGTAAGAATTATIASNLIGAGRLDKVDVGTLVLAGNNSYTGGTSISGGTLQLGEGGTSGSIVGGVQDNATLAINRSDAVTLAGVISGSGVVVQRGTGNTTLAAANTYSGGTTIAAGTLTGTSGSFGTGTITDNAALVINQPTDASMANAINGTGSLTKTGAGALNYTGTGTLSGPTTVAAGTLAVNASLANSAVAVSSGATLAGMGTVGATTLQGGATVAPGNGAIGTLNVNGNFAQAAGSTYQVQVDSSTKTSSDRINVLGAAAISSGAILNVARTSASPYTLDARYTVLSAAGGVAGTYALTGDTRTAFVRVSDTYDANNVYLTASQDRPFTAAGLTVNQLAAASGLGTLGSNSVLRNAVAFLPNDVAARAAFDQLSGEEHASIQTALLDDSRFVREAANDRLLEAFCAPGADTMTKSQVAGAGKASDATGGCVPSSETMAWGRVFGSTGHFDSDGNAQRMKRDISGLFVGADMALSAGWRVGALGGYSHTSTDAANGSGKSDDYHLGVYGGNQWDGTALRLGASYTWHKLDTQRSVAFTGLFDSLSSKYDGATAQIFGELGHRFDLGQGMAIEPFAGLAYVNVKTDGFAERGGVAALTGGSASMDTTFSTLGARFNAKLGDSTTFRGMLGWRHAFGDVIPTSTNAFLGSQPFTVSGVPLARNVAVVEAGVETQLQPNLTLSGAYSGQFGSKVRDNGVKVSLAYKF